jgi:hypothetical protein
MWVAGQHRPATLALALFVATVGARRTKRRAHESPPRFSRWRARPALDSSARHSVSRASPLFDKASSRCGLQTRFVPQMCPNCDGACDRARLGPRSCSRQPQEHHHGPIQPEHLCVIESTKTRPELRPRYGGDLVHHQAARRPQAVALVGLDRQAEQRSIGGIRREGADCYGGGRIEAIILHDNDRTRLSCVVFPAGSGPDLAAPHSETASIKS